jgi:CMP-N-acetylneuraminic acid synthetase
MKKKKILCIIPARKGSVGLVNKNIKLFNGKPLIQWTLDAALKSKLISKISLSTDSEEIINLTKKKYDQKIDIPFKRPKKISGSKSLIGDAIIHTLKYYQKKQQEFDYIALLEPTSPIRFKNDIDTAISKLIKKKDFDSLVSVGEIRNSPYLYKKIYKDKIINFIKNKKKNLNRQNFEKIYFPFGVIYLSKVKAFIKKKTFYTNKTTFYKIKPIQCYEIDDIYDFNCAETLIKKINKL